MHVLFKLSAAIEAYEQYNLVKRVYFNVYELVVHADAECKEENETNDIPTKVSAIRAAVRLGLYYRDT